MDASRGKTSLRARRRKISSARSNEVGPAAPAAVPPARQFLPVQVQLISSAASTSLQPAPSLAAKRGAITRERAGPLPKVTQLVQAVDAAMHGASAARARGTALTVTTSIR